MCYVNTSPRTALFGTCPLKFNTYADYGLCTDDASGNTLSRDCFHLFDESVREISSRFSRCPSPSVAQANWINHCLCPELRRSNFMTTSNRRHCIRQVLLPGLEPSLPCRTFRPRSTLCRAPPLHVRSCLGRHRRQRRSDRLNSVVSDVCVESNHPYPHLDLANRVFPHSRVSFAHDPIHLRFVALFVPKRPQVLVKTKPTATNTS